MNCSSNNKGNFDVVLFFLWITRAAPSYISCSLSISEKVNQLPLSQKCQKQGHQKEFDFLTALCDSQPPHRSMPVLLQLPVSRPCRRREGERGTERGAEGGKGGTCRPFWVKWALLPAHDTSQHQPSSPASSVTSVPVWKAFNFKNTIKAGGSTARSQNVEWSGV